MARGKTAAATSEPPPPPLPPPEPPPPPPPRSLRRAASRTAASPAGRCPGAASSSSCSFPVSPGPPPPELRSWAAAGPFWLPNFLSPGNAPPSRPGTPPPPPPCPSGRVTSGIGVRVHRAPAPRPRAHLAGRGRAGQSKGGCGLPEWTRLRLISLPGKRDASWGHPLYKWKVTSAVHLSEPAKCASPSPEVLGTRKTGNTVIHPGSVETREVW